MSRSFLIEAQKDEGVAVALSYAREELGLVVEQNPDVSVLSFSVLSVDDARLVASHASQGGLGGQRALVIACERIFHEAQNALLKLFEEPPEGLTLFLVVPTKAILLPTILSRLGVLESGKEGAPVSDVAASFIAASKAEREKIVSKLLTQSKSDNEETKQQARTDAVALLGGVIVLVHRAWEKNQSAELRTLLGELVTLYPILRQRSAPYKLIFEHLLLVLPADLK